MTGGVIAASEDDDLSASRELAEELGMQGYVLTKKACCPFQSDNNKVWGNIYYIKVDWKTEDLSLQASEVESVEWWTLD